MKATEVKNGMAVKLDGKVYIVMKYEHTKPGKGPAYMQMKLRDIESGGYVEKRFGSSDSLEATTVDRRDAEFLYEESDGYVFMDSEDFDQFTLQKDFAEEAMLYLRPNSSTTILFFEGRPIQIELPAAVELVITEAQPGIKGATATNQLKEAICETGLKTRVPPFIETGETIKVSTADGSYISRAKD
ncbi:MAG: elongation factor P [Planctomycetota bacterium]